jgi:hypothetical protein
VAAHLLQHLGVLADLAAHDRAQAGDDVAADAAAAHDDTEHLAQGGDNAMARLTDRTTA